MSLYDVSGQSDKYQAFSYIRENNLQLINQSMSNRLYYYSQKLRTIYKEEKEEVGYINTWRKIRKSISYTNQLENP